MWQTESVAKQSTRRGDPSLTEDSQVERERLRSVYTFSCIMLTTKKLKRRRFKDISLYGECSLSLDGRQKNLNNTR